MNYEPLIVNYYQHEFYPRPTTHDPRPTTHDPRPTTHDPRPLVKLDIFMCARYFLCFQVYCLSRKR